MDVHKAILEQTSNQQELASECSTGINDVPHDATCLGKPLRALKPQLARLLSLEPLAHIPLNLKANPHPEVNVKGVILCGASRRKVLFRRTPKTDRILGGGGGGGGVSAPPP